AVLEVVEEVEEAHAGLDDRVGELVVDLQHAVHAPEADLDRVPDPRCRAAVGEVAALTECPQRNAELVGDANDLLDVGDRVRRRAAGSGSAPAEPVYSSEPLKSYGSR